MEQMIFGTDGIRGEVNKEPMTASTILSVGQAAAAVFTKNNNKTRHKIIIGKDTRASGYIYEYALTSGLCSLGADVYLVGPMPTPAIGHLVKSFAADAGIMISASHNPVGDNGIKFFASDGFKVLDAVEADIEKHLQQKTPHYVTVDRVGKAYKIEDARGRYIEYVKQSVQNRSLKGYKIVLDCANGAAYKVAPLIFQELGADVIVLHDKPDGLNINNDCGSEHPEKLQIAVKKYKADVGIALDGDADRVLLVDENGTIVDGDTILAIAALFLKKKNLLAKNTVVTTIVANTGFLDAMKKEGITIVKTAVGDRYVIEEMRKQGAVLGGEQSGHMIFGNYTTTGDGTLAALQLLNIIAETKQKLSALATCMNTFPQITVNVSVKKKVPLDQCKNVQKAIADAEKKLGTAGRIIVRYSGTQMLCRIMVEGKDEKQLLAIVAPIKKAVEQEVGV